jgi:predicted TIM-barrel fold metal-dependent hydrolase
MQSQLREPSRREFLVAAAVGGAATLTRERATLASDPAAPDAYIDAHSHIWTPDTDRYPLAGKQTKADLKPPSFTPEELLAVAKPHGVTRVVLIQHKPYHGIDNRYITDAIARFPGVFSGVACIEADAARPQDEMARLKTSGVRGFRIRPGEGGAERWVESAGMRSMWAFAADNGLAICPLIDAEFLPQVAEMCTKFPKTTVVVDHFARIGIDGTIREQDLNRLAKLADFQHAHVKVSAFYALGKKQPPHRELVPMIRRLYDAYGPQRLMWASDCPYQLGPPNTYGDSVALIRERVDFLTSDDRAWLLRKTAEKVYFS